VRILAADERGINEKKTLHKDLVRFLQIRAVRVNPQPIYPQLQTSGAKGITLAQVASLQPFSKPANSLFRGSVSK
jgi:hypothetical protein